MFGGFNNGFNSGTNPVSYDDLQEFQRVVRNCGTWQANQYLQRYGNLDDALDAYESDYNCNLSSRRKKKAPKTLKGNEMITAAFNKFQKEDELDDDTFDSFCQEIKVPTDKFYPYLICYLSSTKVYQLLRRGNIDILNKNPIPKDIKKYLEEKYEDIKKNNFNKFLMYVHALLRDLLGRANKANGLMIIKQEKDFNVSHASIKKGEMILIDFMQDVLKDLLPEGALDSRVYSLFVDYVRDVKERGSLSKDAFSYIPSFLKLFPKVSSLKKTQQEIDEMVSLPILYTDFLTYYNEPKK